MNLINSVFKGCHNFTYFANDVGKRCILFRHCPSTMPCMKCVSGPRMPPIMKCGLAKKSATTKNTGVTGVNQLLNGKIIFLKSRLINLVSCLSFPCFTSFFLWKFTFSIHTYVIKQTKQFAWFSYVWIMSFSTGRQMTNLVSNFEYLLLF